MSSEAGVFAALPRVVRMRVSRLDHLTLLARKPARSMAFYEGVLRFPLVRETVNEHDPHTFEQAFLSPDGVELVVHYYPKAQKGRVGSGGVKTLLLAVPRDSLASWSERLKRRAGQAFTWRGRSALQATDPDGCPICLIESEVKAAQMLGVVLGSSQVDFWSSELQLKPQGEFEEGFTLECGPHLLILQSETGEEPHLLGYGVCHHLALALCGESELGNPQQNGSRYLHTPCGVLCELTQAGDGGQRREGPAGFHLPKHLEPRRREIREALRWTGRVSD